MPEQRIILYYQSLRPSARRKMRSYQNYFAQQQPPVAVQLVPSSKQPTYDIQQLQQHAQTADELLVIGGDGSINIAAQVAIPFGLPLTVVAAGTGNDFCRDLRITDWRWRMQPLAQCQRLQLNVGQAGTRYFVNHAGSGLSVDLLALQPRWLKYSFGALSYVIAVLRYLFGPYARRQSLTLAGQVIDFQVVAIGRYIGGGIEVNPQGARQGAEMQWLSVPRRGRWQQLQAFWRVRSGRGAEVEWLQRKRAAQFELGASGSDIELDGERHGPGPLTVQVIERALSVYLPPTADPLKTEQRQEQ